MVMRDFVALSCRNKAQQFRMIDDSISTAHEDYLQFRPTFDGVDVFLSPREMCDPKSSGGPRSMAFCIGMTLARLQDIWLRKIITSGLAVPAMKVISGTLSGSLDLAYATGRLVLLLVYATLAAGHLPLMMPMILVATVSETYVAALLCNQELSVPKTLRV